MLIELIEMRVMSNILARVNLEVDSAMADCCGRLEGK